MSRYLAVAASILTIVVLSQIKIPPALPEIGGLSFERITVAEKSGDVKLVGDIDGDGLPDLVLGGGTADGLAWWRWPDLRETLIARPDVEFTTDGRLADIDGDGDLDIVVPDGPDGRNLLWFENPRPGSDPTDPARWQRHEIGVVGAWGKDVHTSDFDGDGRMDVAVRATQEVMIFFQEAAGEWKRIPLSGLELGEEGMTSGDVDGDGLTDLVLKGVWTRNPGGAAARRASEWKVYPVGEFNPAFKAVVTDLDQDGHPDILASSSEHTAYVVWFSADSGPTMPWTRHVIAPMVEHAHTLQAGDMDGDGDLDVVVGQMHTSKQRELAIYYNIDGHATRWQRQPIDKTGLHNGVVADLGADGDLDIYGANWVGNPPVRAWINRLDPRKSRHRIDRWTYHRITDAHLRAFGLAFVDVDGDDRTDIVSGPFWYRQPDRPWAGEWEQHRFGEHLDAFAGLDIDGDGRPEIVAQRGQAGRLDIVYLKARDRAAGSFEVHSIGSVPEASHDIGSQGHAVARLTPGEKPAVAVSSGGGVFYFPVPDDPAAGPWQRIRICETASDEGIALADIDGDGRLDLVATTGEARQVMWWRNPGDGSPDWKGETIGTMPEVVFPDRVAVADFDGDGRLDVAVTEENGKGEGAQLFWWRHPENPGAAEWRRHELTARGSLNSMSAADVDGDGDPDIVIGEHRGALRLSILNNVGRGNFIEQELERGKESHLGAAMVDLDGDGDLDIVSIAWDTPGLIHAWRNDAVAAPRQSAGR